jgi:hypothetical protein
MTTVFCADAMAASAAMPLNERYIFPRGCFQARWESSGTKSLPGRTVMRAFERPLKLERGELLAYNESLRAPYASIMQHSARQGS